MVAVVFHLVSVFLLYLLNGIHSASIPRAHNSYGNRQPLPDLWPVLNAHADSQVQLQTRLEAQQKPQRSFVGVSGTAYIRPTYSQSQYRPQSQVFNKPPQESISPRTPRPTQYRSQHHTTLKLNPKEYSQHGPLSTRTTPQAKPRTFEFSIKVPFLNMAKDGTTKDSDSPGDADPFRLSSVQIQSSFNKPSGPQKGSSGNANGPADPSMPHYQLQLEVPIPSRSASTRPLSGLGGKSGQQGALSTPGDPLGNSLGAGQKGPWIGQKKPTNVPQTPQSGSNTVNTYPESFPTAPLQQEILPHYYTNENPPQNPPQPYLPNKANYYSPDSGNNVPSSGSSARHLPPGPISRPQGRTTDLTRSEILTPTTKGNPSSLFLHQPPPYVNRLREYHSSQMKLKPATFHDYGDSQSGQASSSALTYTYEQGYPPSVSMPYDEAQDGRKDPPVGPSGDERSKGQKQQTGSDSQTAASEQGNDGQFKPQFSTGQDDGDAAAPPIERGYDSYPSLAPSRYEQVSRPMWSPGAVHRGKDDTAGFSSLYEYDTDQSEQTLPGRFSAVEQKPPPLIPNTGAGETDRKAPFAKPAMEPHFSSNADESTGYPHYLSPPVKPTNGAAAAGKPSKLPQVDKPGPAFEYAESSPSGLAGYSPGLLNHPSQTWPLYTGYSAEQQGVVQNRHSTSAFETYRPNPLASDDYAPVYNSLPMQTNQDLQHGANSQAANYYIPDPGNYVPIQAASGSSALEVPLKQTSIPQWQTTALNKGDAEEQTSMYNYDQYNRFYSGQVAQPQIPIETPSTISQNVYPSYSTLSEQYYPSEGFEDDFQEGKSRVYPPQDVSDADNLNSPQMFPSRQQTSTFSNNKPALDLYEAVPLDVGSTRLVDRRPLPPQSASRTLQDSSLLSLNMNQDNVERNGNVEPVYRQQGPWYTLPVQSSSQKPADQNRQGAEDRVEVIPGLGSYGYGSSGRETPRVPEYMSNIGEYGLWETLRSGPRQSIPQDVNPDYKPSFNQGSSSEILSSTNGHLTLVPRGDGPQPNDYRSD